MTTSGTYGAVPVTVAALIEHAVRRTGKLPSTVSGEVLLGARNNLYFLLLGLANRGLSLFCQQKQVLPTVPGQSVYALQAGTVDILRVNSRTSTVALGTAIVGDGWQGVDLGEAKVIGSVSVDFATDVSGESLVAETSQDLLTWRTCAAYNVTALAGDLTYQDLERAPAAQYWRIRSVDGTLPSINDLAWHDSFSELEMARLNRDEYQSLPNKISVGSRPTSFWYDKQIDPALSVWPLAPNSLQQLVVWTQRHVQDPGALSGQLAVPARWYEAIIYQLAVRVAEELPKGEVEPDRVQWLKARADEEMSVASTGESDGAPIRIMPNIRRYTR